MLKRVQEIRSDEVKIDYEKIGLRIRNIRIQKKMTQEKLSELADISRPHLSNLENGTKIAGIDTIIKLSNVFKVPVDDLLVDNLTDSKSNHDTDDYMLLLDCSPEEVEILTKSMGALKDILRRYKIKK